MMSNWVDFAYVPKPLYDLWFSREPFYMDSRAELRNGIGYSIEQFRSGFDDPPRERPPRIRKPFRAMLCLL
jgi:hypothetical protein